MSREPAKPKCKTCEFWREDYVLKHGTCKNASGPMQGWATRPDESCSAWVKRVWRRRGKAK